MSEQWPRVREALGVEKVGLIEVQRALDMLEAKLLSDDQERLPTVRSRRTEAVIVHIPTLYDGFRYKGHLIGGIAFTYVWTSTPLTLGGEEWTWYADLLAPQANEAATPLTLAVVSPWTPEVPPRHVIALAEKHQPQPHRGGVMS